MYERQHKPDGNTGKTNGCSDVGSAEHGKNQKEGKHDFNQESRQEIVMTWRVIAVTICGETCHGRIIASWHPFHDDQQ